MPWAMALTRTWWWIALEPTGVVSPTLQRVTLRLSVDLRGISEMDVNTMK